MMKRCSRCVMPETVPGITFDEEGVCSYCRSYQGERYLGEAALGSILEKVKAANSRYGCIVPVSGGRDSTYILYQAKAVHGLKVLAVSYDNEFRTEQALSNIENACSVLGVDFISIRSRWNIARKIVRSEIRYAMPMGLQAIVSVLCNACYYGYRSVIYRAAAKYRVPLILWGESQAEATQQMEGEAFQNRRDRGPAVRSRRRFRRFLDIGYFKVQLYKLLQRIEFHVPGNSFMPSSSPALKAHDITEIRYFDYVPWDRKQIKETITSKLGWRKPEGHVSTWRTDCILHPLVNYCYFNELGCSKACFGYCNMINNGQMTREEALRQEEEMVSVHGEELQRLLTTEIGLSRTEVSRILSLCEKP